MNRRQFLHFAVASLVATPALLRGARAQEGPFRVKYYPVAAGMGSRIAGSQSLRPDRT